MYNRILVCGGRDYQDKDKVYKILYELTEDPDPKNLMGVRPVTIIHGGARGADQWSDDWAVTNWQLVEEYLPNWEKHGKAAGPIRNRRMIDEGKPDVVVAFPGGKGTANMIMQAKLAGIPVMEIE